MYRTISVSAVTILIIILLSSSALAPTSTYNTDDFNQVFNDIVNDYALYDSLMQDVNYINDYQISNLAENPDSAFVYLSKGFDSVLAQAITDFYIQWVPELNKTAVVATDSIPVITDKDKQFMNMRHISPEKVVLERLYTNCYGMDDQYLYIITAQKRGERWIVVDIKWNSLTNASNS